MKSSVKGYDLELFIFKKFNSIWIINKKLYNGRYIVKVRFCIKNVQLDLFKFIKEAGKYNRVHNSSSFPSIININILSIADIILSRLNFLRFIVI